MLNNNLIITGGILHTAFALFHLFFWKIFRWKKDLSSLTYTNRAVMQIMNICLIVFFTTGAYISFVFYEDLQASALGKTLLLSIAFFWFLRTLQQFFFFSIKNKKSFILTIFFIALFAVYFIPFLNS